MGTVPFSAETIPASPLQTDSGIMHQIDGNIENKFFKTNKKVLKDPPKEKIPFDSDIFIIYATSIKTVATRNPHRGSLFITTFCDIIYQMAHRSHIEKIFKMVSHPIFSLEQIFFLRLIEKFPKIKLRLVIKSIYIKIRR